MTETARGAPAVSVIVPTYQRRELVRRAVSSVLAQTFGDFEIVVVDDGSTDGTRESLTGLDPRLRHTWQENRGPAAARNTGLRLARAPVVAFLDSDNRWLPDHLATVTEVLARHPEALLVCTCPRRDVGGRERPADARVVDALPWLLVTVGHLGHGSCIAVRRESILAVGGFDESLAVAEDSDLWLRLAVHGPFCYVRRRTIVKQHTRGSLSERGRRRGAHLPALEQVARRACEEIRGSQRADRDELAERAEGAISYVAALQALARGDRVEAGKQLAEAVRLLPDLSREPETVARKIRLVTYEHSDRLGHVAAAAELWPAPLSDTALFLRTEAVARAVRRGRLLQASRLIAGWPFPAGSGFVVRTAPVLLRLARAALRRRLYRGTEVAV